jgi:hypothetical protein
MHAHAHDTSHENVRINRAESSVAYVLHLMDAVARVSISFDLVEKEKRQRQRADVRNVKGTKCATSEWNMTFPSNHD